MGFWIFWTATILTALVVYSMGRSEERLALSILITAYTASAILYHLGGGSWLDLNTAIVIVDILAFILLCGIALPSKRFWPLPVASLHFVTILSPLIVWVGSDLQSHGVGLLQTLWCYPQLLILNLAAYRSYKRSMTQQRH